MLPISEGDIRAYIAENFNKIRNWLIDYEELNKEEYNIDYECCDCLTYYGSDGFVCGDKLVVGRYCPGENKVKLNLSMIRRDVNDIRNDCLKNKIQISSDMNFNPYDYADIIIFHELAHAYQDKHEKIKLRRDDVEIEQDADEKAIMWYSEYASQQGKSLEAINIIVEYYRKNRGKIK